MWRRESPWSLAPGPTRARHLVARTSESAPRCPRGQPSADHLLGATGCREVGRDRIHVRCVEERHAPLRRHVHDPEGSRLIALAAEGHRAQADLRHLQASPTHPPLLHDPTPQVVWPDGLRRGGRRRPPAINSHPRASPSGLAGALPPALDRRNRTSPSQGAAEPGSESAHVEREDSWMILSPIVDFRKCSTADRQRANRTARTELEFFGRMARAPGAGGSQAVRSGRVDPE